MNEDAMIDHKSYCSVLKTGECNCQHVALPLPSDTFDGDIDHDFDADTYDCHRCIAERAVVREVKAQRIPFGTVE